VASPVHDARLLERLQNADGENDVALHIRLAVAESLDHHLLELIHRLVLGRQ
jgi:hypothetical protein